MRRVSGAVAAGVATVAFGGLAAPAPSAEIESCPGGRAALATASPAEGTLLGMQWRRGRPYLTRLDARSLRPAVEPTVPVTTVSSVSPDGAKLVTGLGGDYTPDGAALRLKFVDVTRMRLEGRMALGTGGGVHSVHWLDDNRVIAVVGQPARAVIVDTESREIVEEIALGVDQIFGAHRFWDSVVVLAAARPTPGHVSEWEIGRTRLHVVTTAGEHDSTGVLDIDAGYEFDQELGGRHRYPGLAVDEATGTAFVVGSLERMAEVALSSMTVTEHWEAPDEQPSLWERLLSFLFGGIAEAKMSTGTSMHAHYVTTDRILIEGANEGMHRSPVQMTLVDTQSGEACRLDSNMSDAKVVDLSIVAWDSMVRLGQGRRARTQSSGGLAAYDLEGRARFTVLRETPICWVEVVGRTAYAYKCGNGVAIVDLNNGDVRHIRPGRPTQLITGDMTM